VAGRWLPYGSRLEGGAGADAEETGWAGRDERVFTYLPLERELLASLPGQARILDLGCGDGSHMALLATGGTVVGVDLSVTLLAPASSLGSVAAATGERLPFRDGVFDLVYVSHVLHHSRDHRLVLREIHRVLRSGGNLVVIETCEDNPLMRLARRIRPEWESVPVRSRFRFAELVHAIQASGFAVDRTEQFNVLYWIWGYARRRWRFLEGQVKRVVRLELAAVKRLRRFSAYGYVVARKATADGLPASAALRTP
jgi:SAM-dependent methyltransferase